MKIKLLQDLPVAAAHGMTAGRIFDVLRDNPNPKRMARWIVLGDAGVEVGVLEREAEEVTEEGAPGENSAN